MAPLPSLATMCRVRPRRTLSRIGVSAPDTQSLDQILIAPVILCLDIIQEAPALAHQLEKPAPRVVVLGVGLEVFRESADPLGKYGDLDLRRTFVLEHRPEWSSGKVEHTLGMKRALPHLGKCHRNPSGLHKHHAMKDGGVPTAHDHGLSPLHARSIRTADGQRRDVVQRGLYRAKQIFKAPAAGATMAQA